MDRYCIVENNFVENHAGSKARNDIADTLIRAGWKPLSVHHSEEKGTMDKIKMIFVTWNDWRKVVSAVGENTELLIQYPLAMYPKVSRTAIPFLKKMKEKNVRLIFLIHDLDSLRGIHQNGEREFLDKADLIIAHNPAMVAYLRENGYKDKEIRSLDIFDYLLDGELPVKKGKKTEIVVAGNLKREKAGYVYHLDEIEGDIQFRLYGPNYDGTMQGTRTVYCGQYRPEELTEHLEGGFGLVWDGEEIKDCAGVYGKYMQYNNPHKTSLYLVSGLPVIIWKKAAMASFIDKNLLGMTVNSLTEIPQKLTELTDEEYREMKKNVGCFRERLSRGEMLLNVLKE